MNVAFGESGCRPPPLNPETPTSGKQVRLMRQTTEITKTTKITHTPEQRDEPADRIEESTPWQSPGYVVVETALEVTAYALATR
jgi:hypothetical protein